MSYKTFGGRSCKSCSGRPSNLPSWSNELRRLDLGSSAAAQSNQSWVKKGLRGVIIFEKNMFYSCLFCFWLYQFHPETRNFALWQSFSLKTVPQKSNLISPHGPMARGSWGRFYPQIYWWNVCSAHGKGRKWKECRYFLKYEVSHHDNHTLVVFFLETGLLVDSGKQY